MTNYSSNNISVVNTSSLSVTATFSTGAGSLPEGIAITSDGTTAYVANYGTNNVAVIDVATNAITNTIGVGNNPLGVALTPCQAPTPTPTTAPTTTVAPTEPEITPAFTG